MIATVTKIAAAGGVLLLSAAALTAQTTLKDAFPYFLIGAAINQRQFTSPEADNCETALIVRQFDSITPENVLKWESVHPDPDRYDFKAPDAYVQFGVQHKMFIIGHNLVWHNQTPAWVFEGSDGKPLDRSALLARMKDHIFTVVGRYKGKIKGWDVVNEALADDGELRHSRWWKIIGDDYLPKAYQFAHEADPDAQLYYNEYSMEDPEKRAGAIALIKRLQGAGIPLAGVGMQGHYRMDWPSPEQVEQTIEALAATGVKVMITELDVDALPPAAHTFAAEVSLRVKSNPTLNPYPNGLPQSVQEKLAQRYNELFRVFVKHRAQISRVTFWGVTDADSWLNNWPVPGRINYPLLFDRQCQPKAAFDSVLAVAKESK